MLKKIFTWWNGPTLGAMWTVAKRGVFVGEDSFGNRYYEAKDHKDSFDGDLRRWVMLKGYAEASKVPPEWHGWLHHTHDERPTDQPAVKAKAWEKPYTPNLSGTLQAWRPKGSIARGGKRAHATGDYEPWKPE